MKIYANARIHTMAHKDTTPHDAMVVDEDRIAYVGSLPHARDFAPGAEEIDCGGSVLMPGLVDAHIHAHSTAASLGQVDLSSATTLAEAVELIADYETAMDKGQWLLGGKWDANTWTDTLEPNRELLDQLVPHTPVAVWSVDLHTLWLNGAALEEVGIDDLTPDPRGGRIVRDDAGHATGVLREDAATIAERRIPVPSIERRHQDMLTAQRTWHSQGITGIHDFDGNASSETWQSLINADELSLKVVKYLRLDEWDLAKESGWRTGERSTHRYIHGGLKLFSDGALGSQTCHMCHPFPAGHYGLPIASTSTLVEQITDAYSHNISVAIHAIGDAANHSVLTALRQAGQPPARPRVEHAQFMQEEDIQLMRELGAIASMQPRHCSSDIPLLHQVENNPGLVAYPWKQLLAAGIPLAFGSDAPVEPTNPWAGIYSAMTRADVSGDLSTQFQAQNCISAYDAIAAHTRGAAFAAGIEEETGTLAPGMDADFIVINTDPFDPEADATAIRDTAVLLTVAGGNVVHSQ